MKSSALLLGATLPLDGNLDCQLAADVINLFFFWLEIEPLYDILGVNLQQ